LEIGLECDRILDLLEKGTLIEAESASNSRQWINIEDYYDDDVIDLTLNNDGIQKHYADYFNRDVVSKTMFVEAVRRIAGRLRRPDVAKSILFGKLNLITEKSYKTQYLEICFYKWLSTYAINRNIPNIATYYYDRICHHEVAADTSQDKLVGLQEGDKQVFEQLKPDKLADKEGNNVLGTHLLLTEMMEGCNLGDLINKLKDGDFDLSVNDFACIIFQLMYTFVCFSYLNFIHRDIHTGNVFIEILPEDKPAHLTYIFDNKAYSFTTRYFVKIFDFDRSCTVTDDIYSNDGGEDPWYKNCYSYGLVSDKPVDHLDTLYHICRKIKAVWDPLEIDYIKNQDSLVKIGQPKTWWKGKQRKPYDNLNAEKIKIESQRNKIQKLKDFMGQIAIIPPDDMGAGYNVVNLNSNKIDIRAKNQLTRHAGNGPREAMGRRDAVITNIVHEDFKKIINTIVQLSNIESHDISQMPFFYESPNGQKLTELFYPPNPIPDPTAEGKDVRGYDHEVILLDQLQANNNWTELSVWEKLIVCAPLVTEGEKDNALKELTIGELPLKRQRQLGNLEESAWPMGKIDLTTSVGKAGQAGQAGQADQADQAGQADQAINVSGGSSNIYYHKYLKYKAKYLSIKNRM
jgi:uncharacterized membrane protein YhdT